MSSVTLSGCGTLGGRQVYRLDYGAMQLADPGAFGPPKDPEETMRILQTAIEAGINHIDASDFYGLRAANQLIRRAPHPYPNDLYIVIKVSARRDEKGNWLLTMSPTRLTQAVEDNLRNLGPDVLGVMNLRSTLSPCDPVGSPLGAPLVTLLKPGVWRLIRHVGLGNVAVKQIADAQKITPIVCVQNLYNIAHHAGDTLVDAPAVQHIMQVSFFLLGGFTPLQVQELNRVAASSEAIPMQVALAWPSQRSPSILLIPGASSHIHLAENIATMQLTLPDDVLHVLDNITTRTRP